MQISGLDLDVAAKQLKHLFGIEEIFLRRGRRVARYERAADLLFDPPPYEWPLAQFEAMGSLLFRRVVHAVATTDAPVAQERVAEVLGMTNPEAIGGALRKAVDVGMLCERGGEYARRKPVGFGPTFEWYVSGVCVEALASIAYWGVKVEGLDGDYDVVVIRDGQVGYIECKAGKVGGIAPQEIVGFLRRERLLAPRFSVYLVDGVSLERLEPLVECAIKNSDEYALELPGIMETEVTLSVERYRHFLRLVPINAFFVESQRPIPTVLQEIYQFLTVVCDRDLRTENRTAKAGFK